MQQKVSMYNFKDYVEIRPFVFEKQWRNNRKSFVVKFRRSEKAAFIFLQLETADSSCLKNFINENLRTKRCILSMHLKLYRFRG